MPVARRTLLVGLGATALLPGCALVFTGPKGRDVRTKKIIVGYLVLEILLAIGVVGVSVNGLLISVPLGVIALIVDFATGAIYKRVDGRPWGGSPGGGGDDDEGEDDEEPPRDMLAPTPVTRFQPCAEGSVLLTSAPEAAEAAVLAFARHAGGCAGCLAALASEGPVEVLPGGPVLARASATVRSDGLADAGLTEP